MAKITRPQAEVATIISNIAFRALALIVVLGLLIVGFGVFIYALLNDKQPVATSILGGVDLMLGFLTHQVYASLFPTDKKPAPTES